MAQRNFELHFLAMAVRVIAVLSVGEAGVRGEKPCNMEAIRVISITIAHNCGVGQSGRQLNLETPCKTVRIVELLIALLPLFA